MSAFLLSYWLKGKVWIIAVGGAIVAAFGVYKSIKNAGKHEAEVEITKEIAKDQVQKARDVAAVQVETIKAVKHETDIVNATPADAVTSELRDDWQRD